MTLEQIREEAMALPEVDRVLLGEELLIGPQSAEELADIERSWITEAERRLEDMRTGKSKTVPHEEVMLELRQLIRR